MGRDYNLPITLKEAMNRNLQSIALMAMLLQSNDEPQRRELVAKPTHKKCLLQKCKNVVKINSSKKFCSSECKIQHENRYK